MATHQGEFLHEVVELSAEQKIFGNKIRVLLEFMTKDDSQATSNS